MSPGWSGEELRWGEAELTEAGSEDDSGGRGPAGCAAAVCPMLHHDDDRGRLVPRQDQQHRVAAVGPVAARLCLLQQPIVGFDRSVLDIPPLVHREQARQLGDERLPTPGDIMDPPEIPSLLSTRQKRHGLPPCFSISRDTHARQQLEFRNELDRVGVDDVRIPDLFVWMPYMAPQWRAIEPDWVNEVGEI
ncbi:hypothetical protein PIB30_100500 [Stylosanthes scabra]|uniref:Uncharacterized protein n=1 Tax=Stylosanthes scabra TaxID=79078 RepID=A0ABU6QXS3_9FABA|nr:hypothetical protein [Stylosanthes scabra]